jgi:DNA-binding HxlR family transcriptional regulator
MNKHLGSILESAVRKSEYPISKLAKRIGYTRPHIYNLFQQPKVDVMLMDKIGKIINHDFSDEVKELKKYGRVEDTVFIAGESSVEYGSLEKKYIALLEEYNKLLKEHNELLKKLKK